MYFLRYPLATSIFNFSTAFSGIYTKSCLNSEQLIISLPLQDIQNICSMLLHTIKTSLWWTHCNSFSPEISTGPMPRLIFLSSTWKITINFVKNVESNICKFIQVWLLRLQWPSQVLMALPGGPSFTGLTSHVVRFVRCSFHRASIADFSILSAPGKSAGQKIILQQLPYVGIVVLEQHYNICVILASGVFWQKLSQST